MKKIKEIAGLTDSIDVTEYKGTVIECRMLSESEVSGSGGAVVIAGYGGGSSHTSTKIIRSTDVWVDCGDGCEFHARVNGHLPVRKGQVVTIVTLSRQSEFGYQVISFKNHNTDEVVYFEHDIRLKNKLTLDRNKFKNRLIWLAVAIPCLVSFVVFILGLSGEKGWEIPRFALKYYETCHIRYYGWSPIFICSSFKLITALQAALYSLAVVPVLAFFTSRIASKTDLDAKEQLEEATKRIA